MTARVERTERLLNLVICLMASRIGVSRAEIQRQIPGYSGAPTAGAFERMFERDKDELRSMGIPVETVHDANGEVTGYRVLPESYGLQEIDLTLEERAAIAVAAQVWDRAVVGPVAGTALRKLETIDAETQAWSPADLLGTVHLRATDAALLPLMAAIRQDRTVQFPYRAPSSPEPTDREISPWGLRSSAGRWFLVGFDHGRRGTRTFRLSRISGPVTVTARPREFPPAADFDISQTSITPTADDALITAVLQVTPGRAASLRRKADAVPGGHDTYTADVITISATTVDELLPDVCAAGIDARVLAPPELVRAVTETLVAIRDAHAGVTS